MTTKEEEIKVLCTLLQTQPTKASAFALLVHEQAAVLDEGWKLLKHFVPCSKQHIRPSPSWLSHPTPAQMCMQTTFSRVFLLLTGAERRDRKVYELTQTYSTYGERHNQKGNREDTRVLTKHNRHSSSLSGMGESTLAFILRTEIH